MSSLCILGPYVICLLSVFFCLILGEGSFVPSDTWVSDNVLSVPTRDENLDELGVKPNNSESQMWSYNMESPESKPGASSPKITPAAGINTPSALTLSCATPAPYEVVSWWLFKCPTLNGHKPRYHISEGSTLYLSENYELRVDQNETTFFSKLTIKDINSNASHGFYQCLGHAKSEIEPFFTEADFFIIGKKNSFQNCLLPNNKSLGDGKTFRASRQDLAHLNPLMFDFLDAIPDPAGWLFNWHGIDPPEGQKSQEIPVQNSSFVRFDFTGGEILQNRNRTSDDREKN